MLMFLHSDIIITQIINIHRRSAWCPSGLRRTTSIGSPERTVCFCSSLGTRRVGFACTLPLIRSSTMW